MEEFRFLSPVELLELLRKQQQIKGLPITDYRLAKILGMTPQGVMHTVKHNGSLSDENAIKLADELKLPRAYVVACMMIHRTKNIDVKEMWEDIGSKSLKASVFIFSLTLSFLFFTSSLLA